MSFLRLKFTVSIPARVHREGSQFVAECPLDVVSQADTEAEALAALAEAIQVFMISCFERGVLVEVLKGFNPERPGKLDDDSEEEIGHMLDVPLPLLAGC